MKFDNLSVKRISLFCLGGALNTLGTYIIYILFLQILSYQRAYFLAYFLGILFAYIFNANFVFKKSMEFKTLLIYPLIYLVQYFISSVLLNISIEAFYIPQSLAPLLVIFCIFPISYYLNRYVLELRFKKEIRR